MKKIRVDQLLVRKRLVPTREKGQALIIAGQVFIGEKRVGKPGDLISEEAVLTVRERIPFVSRGGLKLAPALEALNILPEGRICLDVGAGTGGFTDCLLQRGAKKVYALDVGHGQLDPKIRNDPRVVVLEKTNARNLEALPDAGIDLVVIDVSFISLTKILKPLRGLLKGGTDVVPLVKPQFELSPKEVRKGIVRDPALRQKAVDRVVLFSREIGFRPVESFESPVAGAKGNREVFLHLRV